MLKTTIRINYRCARHRRQNGQEPTKRKASCAACDVLCDLRAALDKVERVLHRARNTVGLLEGGRGRTKQPRSPEPSGAEHMVGSGTIVAVPDGSSPDPE